MFNNFTTRPLKARVLWIVALALEAIVIIVLLVMILNHMLSSLLFFTIGIIELIAVGCLISAMTIRGWKQATDHENRLQDKQE